MRIRRRPSQIPAPASSDPAAGGGSCSSGGATGESAAGAAVGKGETVMGTGGLHPSMEAREKGRRPRGGDSVICRLGQRGGGGVRGGSWSGGGTDASCYGEVQHRKRHKGKVTEKEDGVRGAGEDSEEEKDQKPGGAAQPAVGARRAWNHHVAVGGLHTSAAAANGLGADAVASATGAATGSDGTRIASAARKMKNIAWSGGCSRSARSPSSSSSSIKIETTNGVGTARYMNDGDHQLVKDEEEKNREEQKQLVSSGGDNTGNKNNNSSSGKRRRSPAVLMEGSRCSRVNGRGWRCCQQTLVGYSLCEHHLGKGRLRSVSSVRCKKAGSAAGRALPKQPISAVQKLHDKQQRSLANVTVHEGQEEEDDDDNEEDKKPSVGARRGKRIGIVKARSISSLLDQTSSDAVNHYGVVQETFAPKKVLTATSTGLPAALIRTSVENCTPSYRCRLCSHVSSTVDCCSPRRDQRGNVM